MAFSQFYKWVQHNQPSHDHPFAKGWWDWIEWCQWAVPFVRAKDLVVDTSFSMKTPPPTTTLHMPILRFEMAACTVKACWVFSLDRVAPSYFAWMEPKGDYLKPKYSSMNDLFGANGQDLAQSVSMARAISDIEDSSNNSIQNAFAFWNAYDLYAFLKNPFS